MKYKINGRDIELIEGLPTHIDSHLDSHSKYLEIKHKINELIKTLGESVYENCENCNNIGKRGVSVKITRDERCIFCNKDISKIDPSLKYNFTLVEPVVEKKKWDKNTLKYGDTYFYIDSLGSIESSILSRYGRHEWRLKTNNIFETREEAENYKRKILNPIW